MKNKYILSNLNLGLLWFGAAVSIAEILTGTLIAPLGFGQGIFAVVLGHIIGGAVLFLSGLIGALSGLASIESTRISFGRFGSYIFSVLNILQLVGWTAVMLKSGAKAMDTATKGMFGYQNEALWCVLIGVFICVWIIVGFKNLEKLNIVAVGILFAGTLVLCFTIFKGGFQAPADTGEITFGAAVELSAVMPISWLPLISDYTRYAKNKKSGTLVSSICYFAGSCYMYIIGLCAAIYAGSTDISAILTSAGAGLTALLIIIFSTVTTTFLDAYSAGVSFVNISAKTKEKAAALIVCIIGLLIAVFTPIEQYENFLYLIGSVFAPLFAILITDYFVFKITETDSKILINVKNIIIWAVGFIIYRKLMSFDFVLGVTLPVMVLISILSVTVNGGIKLCLKKL